MMDEEERRLRSDVLEYADHLEDGWERALMERRLNALLAYREKRDELEIGPRRAWGCFVETPWGRCMVEPMLHSAELGVVSASSTREMLAWYYAHPHEYLSPYDWWENREKRYREAAALLERLVGPGPRVDYDEVRCNDCEARYVLTKERAKTYGYFEHTEDCPWVEARLWLAEEAR